MSRRSGAANPDRARFVCPTCAQKTWVNTRTGRLYSHAPPQATAVCALSNKVVQDGSGGPAPIAHLQPPPPAPQRGAQAVRPQLRGDEPSVSVRAVSGGLPELGRNRRH